MNVVKSGQEQQEYDKTQVLTEPHQEECTQDHLHASPYPLCFAILCVGYWTDRLKDHDRGIAWRAENTHRPRRCREGATVDVPLRCYTSDKVDRLL